MALVTPRIIWLIIGCGTAIRLLLAFTTVGVPFDIESFRIVGGALDTHPFDVYGVVNERPPGSDDAYRFPYPPGFLPFIATAVGLEKISDLPFHGFVQLGPIGADGAIAWIVQDFLGRRGASSRERTAAASLVALGPAFAAVSGYHGQFDSLAILPAVLALAVWDRSPTGTRRALIAGALIGLGGAIKTVPLLLVLALLPSTRSRGELAAVVGAAAAVPMLAFAPFLMADPHGVRDVLDYGGAPGLGGLSLVVQPSLAATWLTEGPTALEFNDVSQALYNHGAVVLIAALLVLTLFLLRHRPTAIDAAVLVWLTVYAFNPNYFTHYIVWGLPFFLMAGYLREVAYLQAAYLLPPLIVYARPWDHDGIALVYVPVMLLLWAGWLAALAIVGRRVAAGAAP